MCRVQIKSAGGFSGGCCARAKVRTGCPNGNAISRRPTRQRTVPVPMDHAAGRTGRESTRFLNPAALRQRAMSAGAQNVGMQNPIRNKAANAESSRRYHCFTGKFNVNSTSSSRIRISET